MSEARYLCESIVKQGMLHSRGELLLMLDADGATKVTDLEKLESQVCIGCDFSYYIYNIAVFMSCLVTSKFN